MAPESDKPSGRQEWIKICLRLLTTRPRTAAELSLAMERQGADSGIREEVIDELRQSRYVDDAALAEHYLAARAERLAQGPTRLIRELEARGVAPAVARAAWDGLVDRGELDPHTLLEEAVRRRLGEHPGDHREKRREPLPMRAYRRVYNALLRAGFEASEVIDSLAPYRPRTDRVHRDLQHESQDEIQ